MLKIDRKRTVQLLISGVITIGFLYFFDRFIGFDRLITLFRNITLQQFLLAFALYLVSYFIRTLRWSISLDLKDLKKLFKLTVFNTFFNIILPFRVGEFSFFYMLKKEGLSLGHTTMSFITTRLFDGIGIVSIFLFFYFLYLDNPMLGLSAIILSPLIFFPVATVMKKIKHQEVLNYQSKLTFKNTIGIYILTIMTLVFKFFAFYIILFPLTGLSVSLSFLAFSTADLTTVLPIHGIAGIGTYESGFAGIAVILGAEKDSAFLSAALVHIFIIFSSSLIALITYLTTKSS